MTRTVDADGVASQVGELAIARDGAAAITGTTVGITTDRYDRDAAGRLTSPTVRIRSPLSGELEGTDGRSVSGVGCNGERGLVDADPHVRRGGLRKQTRPR